VISSLFPIHVPEVLLVEEPVEFDRDLPEDQHIDQFKEELDVGKSYNYSSESQLYVSIVLLAPPVIGGVEDHPCDVVDP
jgi:hypothetical protein